MPKDVAYKSYLRIADSRYDTDTGPNILAAVFLTYHFRNAYGARKIWDTSVSVSLLWY